MRYNYCTMHLFVNPDDCNTLVLPNLAWHSLWPSYAIGGLCQHIWRYSCSEHLLSQCNHTEGLVCQKDGLEEIACMAADAGFHNSKSAL